MAKPPLIWLTRPRNDSIALAAKLAEHGIDSIVAPVMHVVHQPLVSMPMKPHAILLTSRHAAHALASFLSTWRSLPVYCVGKSTASAAAELGCTHIIPSASSIVTLLPRIVDNLGAGTELLYLAGEDTSVDVAHFLNSQGVYVTTCIVYHAIAERALDEAVHNALTKNSITGVTFFSPRTAEITRKLLQSANMVDEVATMDAFCLSANVSSTAGKLDWKNIYTCSAPTLRSMHELIVSHADKTL